MEKTEKLRKIKLRTGHHLSPKPKVQTNIPLGLVCTLGLQANRKRRQLITKMEIIHSVYQAKLNITGPQAFSEYEIRSLMVNVGPGHFSAVKYDDNYTNDHEYLEIISASTSLAC